VIALVVLTALGIFALRASFIVGSERLVLPPRLAAALSHTRPAVFGALLVSATVGGGHPALPDGVTIVVLGVTALVARRHSMGPTVLAGIAAIAAIGLIGA
jgi:branched-subunit amino acid transport protein